MAEPGREYEVISVSLPRDLVARINEIVPRTRRSRIIRELLSSFVDSAGRRRVAEEYRRYYARRSPGRPRRSGACWRAGRSATRKSGPCSSERRPVAAVRRGDIVLASLDPTVGVEIRKTRPVVVVSNDHINELSQLVVVVPLTKSTSHLSPSHAVIPRDTAGLSFASKALTEQVKAVDKRRLVRRLGALPAHLLAQIDRALKTTLALR